MNKREDRDKQPQTTTETVMSVCRRSFKKYFEIKEEIGLIDTIESVEINKEGICFNIKVGSKTVKIYMEPPLEDGQPAPGIIGTILTFGDFETDVESTLLKLSSHSKVAFDIGANVGYYSLAMLKNNMDLEVHSFEPNKQTFERLEENFEANELKKDYLNNFGLSNEKGEAKLFFDERNLGAASMRDLEAFGEPSPHAAECSMITMDEYVDSHNISQLDFIKCDVEGAELLVFQGGKSSIMKLRPVIISEMLRKWSAKFDYHPNDIIKLFKDMNYVCYALGSNKISLIEEVTDETVETNYLFVPEEKKEEILALL